VFTTVQVLKSKEQQHCNKNYYFSLCPQVNFPHIDIIRMPNIIHLYPENSIQNNVDIQIYS